MGTLYNDTFTRVLAALVARDPEQRDLCGTDRKATNSAAFMVQEARAIAQEADDYVDAGRLIALVGTLPAPPGSKLHVMVSDPNTGWGAGEWWEPAPLFAFGVRADGEVLPLTCGSNPIVEHVYEPSGTYVWAVEDASGVVMDSGGKQWPSLAAFKADVEPQRLAIVEAQAKRFAPTAVGSAA